MKGNHVLVRFNSVSSGELDSTATVDRTFIRLLEIPNSPIEWVLKLNSHQSRSHKMLLKVEKITYNALPAALTGGEFFAFVKSSLLLMIGRYVESTVPSATKSSRLPKYESVSDQALWSRQGVDQTACSGIHSRTMGK